MKKCNTCDIEKPLIEFYKNNKGKGGLSQKCKACSIEYRKKHYEENRESILSKKKEYGLNNRNRINNYLRERKQKDPLFKMKHNLRSRTYYAFKNKGYSKKTRTKEMLGVDWEIAKKHIERQFKKGMTWDNYGKWHIDHIIPLASADTEERIKQLCHYSNLQPMWADENLSKADKIINQQTKIII